MEHSEALAALRELQTAQPLLTAWTIAERATAILDRSGLKTLDLTAYLIDRGYEGARLNRAMTPFAAAVKRNYLRVHGLEPAKRIVRDGPVEMRVFAYLETDRPIVDAAFEQVLA